MNIHAQCAEGCEARLQRFVVDLVRMQLSVDPLVYAHVQHRGDVSRTGTEGETVEGMQRTLSLVLSGFRWLVLFPCQQLRGSIGQDQAKHGNNQLRAAQSHRDPPDKRPAKTSPLPTPEAEKVSV